MRCCVYVNVSSEMRTTQYSHQRNARGVGGCPDGRKLLQTPYYFPRRNAKVAKCILFDTFCCTMCAVAVAFMCDTSLNCVSCDSNEVDGKAPLDEK